MTEESIRRQTIAEEADAAAQRTVASAVLEPNPYFGLDDERAWKSAYERYLLKYSAPEAEGGA